MTAEGGISIPVDITDLISSIGSPPELPLRTSTNSGATIVESVSAIIGTTNAESEDYTNAPRVDTT